MKARIRKQFEQNLYVVGLFSFLIARISKWQCSRILPLRWLGNALSIPLYVILKDRYYELLLFAQKSKLVRKRKPLSWGSILPSLFFIKVIIGDKSATPDEYVRVLKDKKLSVDAQFAWANRFMGIGRLDLAKVGLLALTKQFSDKVTLDMQLHILRQLGVVCFMMGNNSEANHFWKLAGQMREVLYKPKTPRRYRILSQSWLIAIGHIAMLDYYLKYIQLYEPATDLRIVAQWPINPSPGRTLLNKLEGRSNDALPGFDLLNKFTDLGITLIKPEALEEDYNQWAKKNWEPQWSQLSAAERAALIDDFWERKFPDGEVLGYAHAAARIQREWEAAKRPPLLSLSEMEREWLATYLTNIGIPPDAWYVCLHIREAGFHKEWNILYPSMRDAEITDYYSAIAKIVQAGGWVLRMGDSSMKPLPPMPNVIDYAHSPFKTPMADMLVPAGCRFFLGTNSGYATISAIYNVPCVFTNWVPIGWPLWPSQDLMIPKLFREKKSGRHLSLEQVFRRGLAFIQNSNELPTDLEVVANTPDDLADLTLEMLTHCKKKQLHKAGAPAVVQEYYKQVAKRYGTFTGSRLGKAFVEKHQEVFLIPENEPIETSRGNEIPCQGQLNDNMIATLN